MDRSRTELLAKATCPNCWNDFPVENVKWIAAHEELLGDTRLGDEAPIRFTPTRFDVSGKAVDRKGLSCQELACPNCHLKLPRSVIGYQPFFVSITGTPSCGKSFFLASMTWQLRKTLPEMFELSFSDSDGECNKILNDYEEQLFFAGGNNELAKLAKTDVVGDWYSMVRYGDQTITYPKPFYFDIRPRDNHAHVDEDRVSKLLCLYDNAGESFLPGADTVANPVTRHLGLAKSWMFCFDPTQDPRFRKALTDRTEDHQVVEGPVTARQETVLNEMINRIRKHGDIGLKEKSNQPLIVVCTKYDAWSSLLDMELPEPWRFANGQKSHVLELNNIQAVSDRLQNTLRSHCPEVVAAAESISKRVFFVPVSATGCSPVRDESTGDYMIRVADISPIWCEVPLLLAMAYRSPRLVRATKIRGSVATQSTGQEG